MSVLDVLDWAERHRVTGTLLVERGTVNRRLAMKGGAIVRVASSQAAEQLGRFLVDAGHLTEEQLAGAQQPGQPLGLTLVARGLIREEDLRAALESKIRESVYDLLSWDDGSFSFEPGP